MNTAVVIFALALRGVVLTCARYVARTHSQPMIQYPQLEPETYIQSGTLNSLAGRQAALDALMAGGMLTPSINATPSMEDGNGMADLSIENSPEDGDRFTVAILREDTGETLFQPGYLSPEQCIGETPLDVGLAAGVYACVANFDAYHISDNVYIGKEAARITLYVRN